MERRWRLEKGICFGLANSNRIDETYLILCKEDGILKRLIQFYSRAQKVDIDAIDYCFANPWNLDRDWW